MFPEYPYLNVNDLNLDYLLKRVKSIEEQIKTIKEEIEGEIFEWVQEQLKPFEEQLTALIEEVNTLSENVEETLNAYDQRITDFENRVNELIAGIRQDLVNGITATNELTDLKIEQNNTWLLNEISQNVGDLFQVLNPFTGTIMSIQEMIDYLSAFHINDAIDYDTMAARALTYNDFAALNITYTDLTLHGNSLYV